jgi:hypothetical protein
LFQIDAQRGGPSPNNELINGVVLNFDGRKGIFTISTEMIGTFN